MERLVTLTTQRVRSRCLLSVIGALALIASSGASAVSVKYVGEVDLSPYDCTATPSSSFVRFVCFDASSRQMLTKLNTTWYLYCRVSESTVDQWLAARAHGRHYNRYIKGRFDCRQ